MSHQSSQQNGKLLQSYTKNHICTYYDWGFPVIVRNELSCSTLAHRRAENTCDDGHVQYRDAVDCQATAARPAPTTIWHISLRSDARRSVTSNFCLDCLFFLVCPPVFCLTVGFLFCLFLFPLTTLFFLYNFSWVCEVTSSSSSAFPC